MAKYDQLLSNMLKKYYSRTDIDEDIISIIEQVINTEMNKLDNDKAWGVKKEITRIITEAAEEKQKEK